MARPIEPTPVLKGKDAKNLLRSLNVEATPEKQKLLKECARIYETVSKNSK